MMNETVQLFRFLLDQPSLYQVCKQVAQEWEYEAVSTALVPVLREQLPSQGYPKKYQEEHETFLTTVLDTTCSLAY